MKLAVRDCKSDVRPQGQMKAAAIAVGVAKENCYEASGEANAHDMSKVAFASLGFIDGEIFLFLSSSFSLFIVW